jgi:hypothetical protein
MDKSPGRDGSLIVTKSNGHDTDVELATATIFLHYELGSYGKIVNLFGGSKAMWWKIANEGMRSGRGRKLLGLPHMIEVLSCPTCGEVHTQKTCQHTRSKDPRYRLALEFETREEQLEARDLIEELGATRKGQSTYLVSALKSHLKGLAENDFPQSPIF